MKEISKTGNSEYKCFFYKIFNQSKPNFILQAMLIVKWISQKFLIVLVSQQLWEKMSLTLEQHFKNLLLLPKNLPL